MGGKWKTLHEWKDQYLYELTYKGRPVTTDRIRIRPTKARVGYGSWLVHEIPEMGVYRSGGWALIRARAARNGKPGARSRGQGVRRMTVISQGSRRRRKEVTPARTRIARPAL